eukprot:CCRYP_020447-RA/>CCRYP_020447-RA protein AED:0.15 eAED:0.20 QI:0/-1/0/1/-1/1/1/0/387
MCQTGTQSKKPWFLSPSPSSAPSRMGQKPESRFGPDTVPSSSSYCVNKAYSTAKKMGLIPACNEAEKAYDSKKAAWKAVLRELAEDPLSKTAKEAKTAESLSLKADMLALKAKMTDSALEVFQLYANLLTEEARQPWDLIVKEQTESMPFHDIFGVERKKSLGKTSESFRRCNLLHLQSCFAHDAGENLRFYISNCLKKPNKVKIRQFVQRAMQLNNYVEDLPCLYYSPSASAMTQQVFAFTDSELACHILRMCPLKWQDQYHLLEKCYPEGVKPLLLILERIEVAHPVDEKQSTAKPAKAQAADQPSKKFSPSRRIPRKPSKQARRSILAERNCEAVQKHGAHTPRITPRSVAATTRTELLRWVLSSTCTKVSRRTTAPRNPTHRS